MISNLAVTTPVVGTIRLGDVAVSQKGKRYPVRTNHFKITAQFKDAEGRWVEHPMHSKVAESTEQDPERITEIPVRLMFNDPELNLRARYEAFDKEGRTVCAGNGKCARRREGGKVVTVDCPGAQTCAFGREARCDLFARLNVMIEGQDDEFSSFILRTESYNAVRTLYAKMGRMRAMFGNRLVGVPFLLKLRQKATSMSCWTKFWYADLVLNKVDKFQAVRMAKEYEEAMEAAGLSQQAFEQEAIAGLQNGAFEEDAEDYEEIEAFLLARDSDESPAEGVVETSEEQITQAPGLANLRAFLETADQAGALKLNLTQEAGDPVPA